MYPQHVSCVHFAFKCTHLLLPLFWSEWGSLPSFIWILICIFFYHLAARSPFSTQSHLLVIIQTLCIPPQWSLGPPCTFSLSQVWRQACLAYVRRGSIPSTMQTSRLCLGLPYSTHFIAHLRFSLLISSQNDTLSVSGRHCNALTSGLMSSPQLLCLIVYFSL